LVATESSAPAGASLTLFTVSTKVSVADANPSLTISEMVTVPNWFASGPFPLALWT
jgi:hypothetical protein